MLRELKDRMEEVRSLLDGMGYRCEEVKLRELLDYLEGPTPTRDKITLEDILENRYLMVHEVVEVSELMRVGIPIGRKTITDHQPAVYDAHLRAAEVELTLAWEEGDHAWVELRLGHAEKWLTDPLLPAHLREACLSLLERFSGGKRGVSPYRPAAGGSISRG
jgi:hypothetical protein